MTLNEFQSGAMSTCLDTCRNISYMLTGMSGEVGELQGKFAKAIRKGTFRINENNLQFKDDLEIMPIAKLNEFREGVKGELGDVLWFVAGLAEVCGWSLEDVAQYNQDKLRSRKARGVIEGDGDNR